MTPQIESPEGKSFLETHAKEVAKAALKGDVARAGHLLDQIEPGLDFAYCEGVAFGLYMSFYSPDQEQDGKPKPEVLSQLH